MANNFYPATVLIGGGAGALDAIDGAALADGDAAMVSTDGTIYFYHLDASSGAAESSPDVISPDANAGTKRWIIQEISGAGGAATYDYIRCHDEKSAGTAGGTFTQGAWRTRTITEDQDLGEHCSVAANVITLAAGTYEVAIRAPAFRVDHHKCRLYNTADTATELEGSSERADNVDWCSNISFINGRFTIAAEKTFEVQHYCGATYASRGFGEANSYGSVEIYTVAEFWKIA